MNDTLPRNDFSGIKQKQDTHTTDNDFSLKEEKKVSRIANTEKSTNMDYHL